MHYVIHRSENVGEHLARYGLSMGEPKTAMIYCARGSSLGSSATAPLAVILGYHWLLRCLALDPTRVFK